MDPVHPLLHCWAHAFAPVSTLPGVTTDNDNGLNETGPGTGYRTKKAAYGALADVLDNDTSRKELIDQLRTVAATPPAEPVPKIVPPTLVEEQTVLQKSPKSAAIMVKPSSARFPTLSQYHRLPA